MKKVLALAFLAVLLIFVGRVIGELTPIGSVFAGPADCPAGQEKKAGCKYMQNEGGHCLWIPKHASANGLHEVPEGTCPAIIVPTNTAFIVAKSTSTARVISTGTKMPEIFATCTSSPTPNPTVNDPSKVTPQATCDLCDQVQRIADVMVAKATEDATNKKEK